MFRYFWFVNKKIQSILLVDDDQDDQLLFQEALAIADVAVRYSSACNGIDALEQLSVAKQLPDVMVIDVNMPKMNGIDCLRAIKQSDRLHTIPVIMYSTSCSKEYHQDCLNSGAVAFMKKPSDFSELSAKIKQILNFAFSKSDTQMSIIL